MHAKTIQTLKAFFMFIIVTTLPFFLTGCKDDKKTTWEDSTPEPTYVSTQGGGWVSWIRRWGWGGWGGWGWWWGGWWENKKIDPAYYEQLKQQCAQKSDKKCCEESVESMKQGNYVPFTGEWECPEGMQKSVKICKDAYIWCEPLQ